MHAERDPNLLTVPKAAEMVGVSRYTIRRWIHRGILPAVRIERHWRIAPADLVHAQNRRDTTDVISQWERDPRRAGARLRHFREAAGFSQLQLSGMVGISNAALSILEQGHRAPRIKTIDRLARALDVAADDLVAESPLVAPTVMSATEVATYLDIPLQRVRTWITTGVLPGRKVSRSWHIPRAAVIELERGSQLDFQPGRRKPAAVVTRRDDVVAHSLTVFLTISNFTEVLPFLAA